MTCEQNIISRGELPGLDWCLNWNYDVISIVLTVPSGVYKHFSVEAKLLPFMAGLTENGYISTGFLSES